MKHTHICRGTCSRCVTVDVENGIVREVVFEGGCHGNTQGVSRLSIGRKAVDVIDALRGVDCRGRGTSCPDQLAAALEELLAKEAQA